MAGWHEGSLCGFDLETTSPDPETARVVTAAVIRRGTGKKDSAWLVNPGIEIPDEAAAIHGITTEMAREKGADPAGVLAEISGLLAGVMSERIPLVIYNAPYDLTVMDRETRRLGLEPFGDVFLNHSGIAIDPFVLDKHLDPYRKGKRTLTAVCRHYGVTLDGAHEAGADAIAAMRVAWKIAARYPRVASLPFDELHELQVRAKAGQAASFQRYLMRQGKPEVIDGEWPCRHYEEAVA